MTLTHNILCMHFCYIFVDMHRYENLGQRQYPILILVLCLQNCYLPKFLQFGHHVKVTTPPTLLLSFS